MQSPLRAMRSSSAKSDGASEGSPSPSRWRSAPDADSGLVVISSPEDIESLPGSRVSSPSRASPTRPSPLKSQFSAPASSPQRSGSASRGIPLDLAAYSEEPDFVGRPHPQFELVARIQDVKKRIGYSNYCYAAGCFVILATIGIVVGLGVKFGTGSNESQVSKSQFIPLVASDLQSWKSLYSSAGGSAWSSTLASQGQAIEQYCPTGGSWSDAPCGCTYADKQQTYVSVGCDDGGFIRSIQVINAGALGVVPASAVSSMSHLAMINMSYTNDRGNLEGDGPWAGRNGRRCLDVAGCDSGSVACRFTDLPLCSVDTGLGAWKALKQKAGGEGWSTCGNMDDPCSCDSRISCTTFRGFPNGISKLDLSSNNLVGTIPSTQIRQGLGSTRPLALSLENNPSLSGGDYAPFNCAYFPECEVGGSWTCSLGDVKLCGQESDLGTWWAIWDAVGVPISTCTRDSPCSTCPSSIMTCSGDRIVSLNLENRNLKGTLQPSVFARLDAIRTLRLGGNPNLKSDQKVCFEPPPTCAETGVRCDAPGTNFCTVTRSPGVAAVVSPRPTTRTPTKKQAATNAPFGLAEDFTPAPTKFFQGSYSTDLVAWQHLYDTLDGKNWFKCKNKRDDPCGCRENEKAVVCSYISGPEPRIVAIDLSDNNMRGTVTSEMFLAFSAILGPIDLSTRPLSRTPNILTGKCLDLSPLLDCFQVPTPCIFAGSGVDICGIGPGGDTDSPTKSPTERNSTSPTASPVVQATHSPTLIVTGSPTIEGETSSPTVPIAPSSSPTEYEYEYETFAPTAEEGTLSPTVEPTSETSSPTLEVPTDAPSLNPTAEGETAGPTSSPTDEVETDAPTSSPTSVEETGAPSSSPTSAIATDAPSLNPTAEGETAGPTSSPTDTVVTDAPSLNPTAEDETAGPTSSPTVEVTTTFGPTPSTTSRPSASPTETEYETSSPTLAEDTLSPTSQPTSGSPTTSKPTSKSPTKSPTKVPVPAPTVFGETRSPTASPTKQPTNLPTSLPTGSPSTVATDSPTGTPTSKAPTGTPTTRGPTNAPSKSPSITGATVSPSASPVKTQTPSASPSSEATSSPTLVGTNTPTGSPSVAGTNSPTTTTQSPTGTNSPSGSPTLTSKAPTFSPSNPTGSPTKSPTPLGPAGETDSPTRSPTAQTSGPSTSPVRPSSAPSNGPTTPGQTKTPTGLPTTSSPTTTRSPTSTAPTSRSPTSSTPSGSPTVEPSEYEYEYEQTSSPTGPTKKPTTGSPTKATKSPTLNPTKSSSPTKVSKSPTLTPTTTAPTGSPSQATKSPTLTPTTTVPTGSPSLATKSPTLGTSSPTTNVPTGSPSLATKSPTLGTSSPSTTVPTGSPSLATKSPTGTRSPTTTVPTGSPSLATKSPTLGTSSPTTTVPTGSPSLATKSPTGTRSPTTTVPTGSPSLATKSPTLGTSSPTTTVPTGSPSLATKSPTLGTSSPTTTIPTGSPTLATRIPTQSPTEVNATLSPTLATKSPTIGTQSPTLATNSPTIGTASPTVVNATQSPTLATGSPTIGTASPTLANVTQSPTLATVSPTGSPTLVNVTQSPTLVTGSPTLGTSSPTVSSPTTSPTLVTRSPTGSPTLANVTHSPTLVIGSPTGSPTLVNVTHSPTLVTGSPTGSPTLSNLTHSPTLTTGSPTIGTSSPTVSNPTSSPSLATTAPSSAPTLANVTHSPTLATASPTLGTSSPTLTTGSPTESPTLANVTHSPTLVTGSPTGSPTLANVTHSPTLVTGSPTGSPTLTNVTHSPTLVTGSPTGSPTLANVTHSPTLVTGSPTGSPTLANVTQSPTLVTGSPTGSPTLANMTQSPTLVTGSPTGSPTLTNVTHSPTLATSVPSTSPTVVNATHSPTLATVSPSQSPTIATSSPVTKSPTSATPSQSPTSSTPTTSPTSSSPSHSPTSSKPTSSPTSSSPSHSPTKLPTPIGPADDTDSPTRSPTKLPSNVPSTSPTKTTSSPSKSPSFNGTYTPTQSPAISTVDLLAWQEFYISARGDEWLNCGGQRAYEYPCATDICKGNLVDQRVICDKVDGENRIVEIVLRDNRMRGILSGEALRNMTKLILLDVSNNLAPNLTHTNVFFNRECVLLNRCYKPEVIGCFTQGSNAEICPLPTGAPVPSTAPSLAPSDSPTEESNSPTKSPTPIGPAEDSNSPTRSPTSLPSSNPTKLPTSNVPSQSPTSSKPSTSPSKSPTTSVPSQTPSNAPTKSPTKSPTNSPTHIPSLSPTINGTYTPTQSPAVPTPDLWAWQEFYTKAHGDEWLNCGGQRAFHYPCAHDICSGNLVDQRVICQWVNGVYRIVEIALRDNYLRGILSGEALRQMDALIVMDVSNHLPDNENRTNVFFNKECVRMDRCYTEEMQYCDTDYTNAHICPPPGTTWSPTTSPTPYPTRSPEFTDSPTQLPTTGSPTKSPSDFGPSEDSFSPTLSPTVTDGPTTSPTLFPTPFGFTRSPTKSPTTSTPTKSPTTPPPTKRVTSSPTKKVTSSPTKKATSNPTWSPSHSPSRMPSETPSASPTESPSATPSQTPSESPSRTPTTSKPTQSPTTSRPSNSPTTSRPSKSPSRVPTTSRPSRNPTVSSPTVSPSTSKPSSHPTTSPTSFPTRSPTRADLLPAVLEAWQLFYDQLNGTGWNSCFDARNDPCNLLDNGCELETLRRVIVRCDRSREAPWILNIVEVKLPDNRLFGEIPQDAVNLFSQAAMIQFDISNPNPTAPDANKFTNTECLDFQFCYRLTTTCSFAGTGLSLCQEKRAPTRSPTAPTIAPLDKGDVEAWNKLVAALQPPGNSWNQCGFTTTDPCVTCPPQDGIVSNITGNPIGRFGATCEVVDDTWRIVGVGLGDNKLIGHLDDGILDSFTEARYLNFSFSSLSADDCLAIRSCWLPGAICDFNNSGVHLCSDPPVTAAPSPRGEPQLGVVSRAAWQTIFDTMNGPSWRMCADAREDPCKSCPQQEDILQPRVECVPINERELRFRDIFLPNNNLTGILPLGPVNTLANLGLRGFDLGNFEFTDETPNDILGPLPCLNIPACSTTVRCRFSGAGIELCTIPPTPPSQAPSWSPTKNPTPPTHQPSWSPSVSPVSIGPGEETDSPTASPSTSLPTASPSKSPTTSIPTQSPTTSRPSWSPTGSPTLTPLLPADLQNFQSFFTQAGGSSWLTCQNSFSDPCACRKAGDAVFGVFCDVQSVEENPLLGQGRRVLQDEEEYVEEAEGGYYDYYSEAPTQSPSKSPTVTTFAPTPTKGTDAPTSKSPTTGSPSTTPTRTPSGTPTTSSPSKSPTTSAPSQSPTTSKPSKSPTTKPTHSPSTSPTKSPTPPTSSPTRSPSPPTSQAPSFAPTHFPSQSPTTSRPSKAPTGPTSRPSKSPTTVPFNRVEYIVLPANNLTGILDIEAMNHLTALRLLNLTNNPLLAFPPGKTCEDLIVCRNYVCDLDLCVI